MILKNQLRRLFWKLGFDVCKLHASTNPLTRRKVLLETNRVDTVLDVGANRGQFGGELRTTLGYQGRIVSFEPLGGAFRQLREKAAGFPGWETHNFALGDAPGQAEINVADNSHSSSILDILPAHLKSAPDSRYIGRETITIKTLDSVFSEVCAKSQNIYLKIDTQGFESKVLKGAEHSLPRIRTIQMELALTPLYEGEMLFQDMCELMSRKGYVLVGLDSAFTDLSTGQLLQVDGIFQRPGGKV